MTQPKPSHLDIDSILPGAWADFSQGLTRQQIDNIVQFNAVTAYLEDKPVAVLLSVDEYQRLHNEAFGKED